MNKSIECSAIFITKQKFIKAAQVQQYQQTVDLSGETFIGIPGDWKIWDQDGYIYYINKYQFQSRYRPFTEQSFDMYRNRKKINSLNLIKQDI